MTNKLSKKAELEFVIPVFRKAPYLNETLASLSVQSCPAARISFHAVQIPEFRSLFKIADTVRVVEKTAAQGIGQDWTSALELASADLACIAHSDDIYEPKYVESILAAHQMFPMAGVFFSANSYIQPTFRLELLLWIKRILTPTWFRNRPTLISPRMMLLGLRFGCFVPCPSVTFNLPVVRSIVPINDLFSRTQTVTLDWDAWITLAQKGIAFVYIPQKLVKIRTHSETASTDALKSGIRKTEERLVLSRLWSPRFVKFLSRLLDLGGSLQLESTQSVEAQSYTDRLVRLESKGWKQFLDVQAPYRKHLQRLKLGYTLEIGCGIGRNLLHLHGNGVGVEINEHSAELARKRGLRVLSPLAIAADSSVLKASFDSLLFSHVLEHMTFIEAVALVKEYLPYLKPGGKLVIITPQKAGYQSDSTHREFFDHQSARKLTQALGLSIDRQYSFPFPEFVGKFFLHNEFVSIVRQP